MANVGELFGYPGKPFELLGVQRASANEGCEEVLFEGYEGDHFRPRMFGIEDAEGSQ